jgi:hypothetical protein
MIDLSPPKCFYIVIGGVAREVEGTALEMRHGVNPIVSSNLTPSAFATPKFRYAGTKARFVVASA